MQIIKIMGTVNNRKQAKQRGKYKFLCDQVYIRYNFDISRV